MCLTNIVFLAISLLSKTKYECIYYVNTLIVLEAGDMVVTSTFVMLVAIITHCSTNLLIVTTDQRARFSPFHVSDNKWDTKRVKNLVKI